MEEKKKEEKMVFSQFLVVVVVICIQFNLLQAYDEIQTILHREWETNHIKLDESNTCIKRSLVFGDDDKYFQNFLVQNPVEGLSSIHRDKATGFLTKAAIALPHGDIVETGVYKGHASWIIMQMLKAHDKCNKQYWAYDSFQGLPEANKEDGVWGVKPKTGDMSFSQEKYENNLKSHDAWDDSIIHVTKGYFNETLPKAPVKSISFLRLDGDIFVSTWDALVHLYHKVVPGGYIYVDDYGSFEGCRQAVDMFRTKHHIYEPIRFVREENMVNYIYFESIWWQKRKEETHVEKEKMPPGAPTRKNKQRK